MIFHFTEAYASHGEAAEAEIAVAETTMQVQVTAGPTYEVDTTHPLAGKSIRKRRNCGAGMVGKILGTRQGARSQDRFAFVVQYGPQVHLISRGDFTLVK